MARLGATIYDLLLSCPGDVLDLMSVVKDCVEEFNRLYGAVNNMKVEVKHWSTDSFPQAGEKPQVLLNKQFIHDCDACVALFGNRFGSPTDEYESGTEEEIEDMIKSGKQVFLYFIEREVDSSSIDLEQLGKVRDFKEKFTNRGLYGVIKNKEDFRKQFLNHLTLYFLKLIVDNNNPVIGKIPNLEFATEDESEQFVVGHSKYIGEKLMDDKRKKICNLVNSINEMHLTSTDEEAKNNTLDQLSSKHQPFNYLQEQVFKKAVIDDTTRLTIVAFCKKYDIKLSQDFFQLGNLKKELKAYRIAYMDNKDNLQGSIEETRKYYAINNLWLDICNYNDFWDYFSALDKLFRLNCVIRNTGTTYDEDIDIKIVVPSGKIVHRGNMPVPGVSCIESVNKYDFFSTLFCGIENDRTVKYSDYPNVLIPDYDYNTFNVYLTGKPSDSEQNEKENRKYRDNLNKIFCYEYFQRDDKDILKFNISYLKQNTSMYTPSILFFRNPPESIEVEICSKHYPNIISKKIDIQIVVDDEG